MGPKFDRTLVKKLPQNDLEAQNRQPWQLILFFWNSSKIYV